MGIDAMIMVVGDLTEVATPFTFTVIRSEDIEEGHRGILPEAVDRDRWSFSLDRYFGPAYPRGVWPDLYAFIRAVQATWPNAQVYYGDDHADRSRGELGELCTPEYLESLWQVWLSFEGVYPIGRNTAVYP